MGVAPDALIEIATTLCVVISLSLFTTMFGAIVWALFMWRTQKELLTANRDLVSALANLRWAQAAGSVPHGVPLQGAAPAGRFTGAKTDTDPALVEEDLG